MRRRSPRFPLLGAAGGGAGVTVQQIATRSEQNLAISGLVTTANQMRGGRARNYFAHDCNNIQLGFSNFYNLLSGQTVTETDNTTTPIFRAAIEYNGMSVAFTWNGGNSSATLASGQILQLTDKLPASAFGLEKFTKGDEFWMRMEQQLPVGGIQLYHYAAQNSPSIPGENFRLGALGTSDVLTATGDWPVTGGWSAHGVVWLPQVVIGEVEGTKMSSVVIGASIEHGAGETGRGDGFNLSGGYMRRGFVAGKGAKIMMPVAGESAKSFLANSTKRRALWQYGNVLYFAHGGNDYSYGETVVNTIAAVESIIQLPEADHFLIKHCIGLFPKTDSTDSWATQANQTPRTGFEAGGAWRDAFNEGHFAMSVGNTYSILNASMSGVPSSGTRDKWRTDLGAASTDGTHPSTVVHTAGGTEMAGIIEADRVVIEGA